MDSKKIQFDVTKSNGEEIAYALQFDRAIALQMEKAGFSCTEEFMSKPTLMLSTLFYWGLKKNHPHMTEKLANEMIDNIISAGKSTKKLAANLAAMYIEVVNPNADSDDADDWEMI